MPVPWLLVDILTILVTLLVVLFIMRRTKHPVVVLLECFGFVFLKERFTHLRCGRLVPLLRYPFYNRRRLYSNSLAGSARQLYAFCIAGMDLFLGQESAFSKRSISV
jgi:hypothetical protein